METTEQQRIRDKQLKQEEAQLLVLIIVMIQSNQATVIIGMRNMFVPYQLMDNLDI